MVWRLPAPQKAKFHLGLELSLPYLLLEDLRLARLQFSNPSTWTSKSIGTNVKFLPSCFFEKLLPYLLPSHFETRKRLLSFCAYFFDPTELNGARRGRS